MKLVQVRECDGACCVEGPRFPNADHSDCIFHDQPGAKGCALMRGDQRVPDEKSVIFVERSAADVFQETCVDWPHNTPVKDRHATKTGGCCWQWIDD